MPKHFTHKLRLACAILSAAGLVSLLTAPALYGQSADHPDDQPLRVAADVGLPPFAMKLPSGEVQGFSIDIAAEFARRLGRPGYEIVDVNWSAIFAGLFAKRYEFNIAPTLITPERNKEMLFTEAYLDGGHGLIIRAGEEPVETLDALDGKVVAVNNGSAHDKWASEHAGQYGYSVQRFDKTADCVQAVVTQRVFGCLAELNSSRYAASKQERIRIGHVVLTGQQSGFPFRKDDVAFRNRIERILEGMKLDGTLQRLHEKWFGDVPGPDTAMNKVWTGYGPVGFATYTYEPHRPEVP